MPKKLIERQYVQVFAEQPYSKAVVVEQQLQAGMLQMVVAVWFFHHDLCVLGRQSYIKYLSALGMCHEIRNFLNEGLLFMHLLAGQACLHS